MNFIKKLAVSAATTGVSLALAAMPVMAVADSSVSGISDDSTATAIAGDKDMLMVMNPSFGFVLNGDLALSNTGLNGVFGEDNNHVVSGGAGAGALSSNMLNSSWTAVSGSGDSGSSASVSNVKDDSHGNAYAYDGDMLMIMNLNGGSIWNFDVAVANTGLNGVWGDDKNSVSTGPALAGAAAINVVNYNETSVTGWDGGHAIASVSGIKDDSTGTAIAGDKDVLVITNLNDGFVLNASVAVANTGLNGVGGEDKNSVSSGAALAGSVASNTVNANCTTVTESPDSESASASVSNVKDDSTGTASAYDGDSTVVVNANDGVVHNVSASVANSGVNGVGGDDNNSVTTGDAGAISSSSNTVNTNVTTISM